MGTHVTLFLSENIHMFFLSAIILECRVTLATLIWYLPDMKHGPSWQSCDLCYDYFVKKYYYTRCIGKVYPHCVQLYICCLSALLSMKSMSHWLHVYGFSPVCNLKCFFMTDKKYSKYVCLITMHTFARFLPCTF